MVAWGDPGRRGGRYARRKVASQPAPDSRARARTADAPNERLIDGVIAVSVFAAALGLLVVGTEVQDGTGQVDVATVTLTALTSLPLIWRREAPTAVFVFTALASTALAAIAQPAGPPLGPTLALYSMAVTADGSRRRTRWTWALIAVLLLAHAGAGGLAADRLPGVELLFGILVWGGAWLAGDRTRLRRERMSELEERAERAERDAERERRLAAAEERSRIARDLHDSAGHAINVILVHAGLGRLRSGKEPAGGSQEFETIEQVARETVGEIDRLVGALRDDGSPGLGPETVEPPAGLAALGALADRHRASGVGVTVDFAGDRRTLPASVDRGAYRILQEALTNAARHGNGHAAIEIAFDETALTLTVTNRVRPGSGPRASGGGHGVVGMRERAALLGGSLDAGRRGGDYRVHARLPIAERGT
jgi:signal transduction histidine kinase